MNQFESFFVGLGVSVLAGILCAILALATGILLNRRVRQKTRQFISLLGLVDAAKLSVFGEATIRVSTADAEAVGASKNEAQTPNSNVSVNWAMIRREDDPSRLRTTPYVSSGSSANPTPSRNVVARG